MQRVWPEKGDSAKPRHLTGVYLTRIGSVKQILAERNQQNLRYDKSCNHDYARQNHKVYVYPLRHRKIRYDL